MCVCCGRVSDNESPCSTESALAAGINNAQQQQQQAGRQAGRQPVPNAARERRCCCPAGHTRPLLLKDPDTSPALYPKAETLPAVAALHRPAPASARGQCSLPRLTGSLTDAPSRPPLWGPSLVRRAYLAHTLVAGWSTWAGRSAGEKAPVEKADAEARRAKATERRNMAGLCSGADSMRRQRWRARTKRLLEGGTEMMPSRGRLGRAAWAGAPCGHAHAPPACARSQAADPCRAGASVHGAPPTRHTSARGCSGWSGPRHVITAEPNCFGNTLNRDWIQRSEDRAKGPGGAPKVRTSPRPRWPAMATPRRA